MPLVQLSNIQKSYRDGENRLNHVLRDVNMEIEKGEFVAIKGRSGSGKTTLLSILGTLLPADSGSYRLNGFEMKTAMVNHAEIRNRQIGFVFQDHRLMPQLTALENILLPTLATKAKATAEETDYARQLMEITRIASVARQYPQTLSGGEASRVAVCRALMMKPLLLLADEPTGQLDIENARNMAALLTEINKSLQTTIVMVTHSDETSAAAHRTFTLKEGILQ
ncbi:ABC-type lipoprotein export system ATPase subunit [Parabacteroides sp. PFB2-10]|uniref:ABC transporter ATP-binding protein n=1 Tax=Parabacteroides sp. PFB2-10 TaxID=1742405 RepID=UPI002473492F|nr:ABC transporter ATP-binding protein [Parabacteroides sp. PFB2-10]MDH6314065.1 ABC-type lipoprotein export system ATPase subunit [Parabacteroides sp. PFB2-10]